MPSLSNRHSVAYIQLYAVIVLYVVIHTISVCHHACFQNSDSFMYKVTLIIHTLYVYLYVQLEYVSQKLFCISDKKVHGFYARQWADDPSNGDVVVDSLNDHLREPCLVPCAEDECADKMVLYCNSHLFVTARLFQCTCGEREMWEVAY